MHVRERKSGLWVEFENDVAVEIRLRGKVLGGIGRVRAHGRELRSAEVPILPLILTLEGYEVSSLELEDFRTERGELHLAFRPYLRPACRSPRHSAGADESWVVQRWGQPPDRDRGGRLELTLKEVNRVAGAVELSGFSYGYKFRSRKHTASCIHDRATWELNGRATGNTLIARSHGAPSVKAIRTKDDSFTTSQAGDAAGGRQFLPLFSEMQGFTFQYDRHGLLATAFEEPCRCFSLIQKNRGCHSIIHWHQLRSEDRGGICCLEFPALEVMHADLRARSDLDRLNHYEAVQGGIYGRYRDLAGLQPEPVPCTARLDCRTFSRVADLKATVEELAAAGWSEVALADLFGDEAAADASDSGNPAGIGLTPDVEARAKQVADLARGRGMHVGAVLDYALLEEAMLNRAPLGKRPRAARAEGEPSHSGRESAGAKSWSGPLSRLKRRLSLDALYVDWPPAAEGGNNQLHDALVETGFHRTLQDQGLRCMCSRSGVFGVSTMPVEYALLRGREVLFKDRVIPFPRAEVLEQGDEPVEAYFRGYANRVCYSVAYGRRGGGHPTGAEHWWGPAFAAINRAYRAVSEHMERPRLLADELGVLWTGPADGVSVLWAYAPFEWYVGELARVYDVMAGQAVGVEDGAFTPAGGGVYLVQDALEP
jgi:hypothetical protein